MAATHKNVDGVLVRNIFLSLSNPRHEEVESEQKAIERLCAKENIYALARDIAKIGLNPLERFALIPVDKRKAVGPAARYHVAEGNRRMCALKLLNDPDLAPPKLRKSFEKLAASSTPIKAVPGAVFTDAEAVRVWLDRIHNGPQDGIGRKQWNAEQKTRFDGENKNKAAQALLDYAEQAGMLSAEDRAGKLTTVQRFLSNDVFRETLGFDQGNPDDVARTRPKAEFDVLLKRFIRDLVGKEDVNSRMNKDDIVRYARPLGSLPGVTTTRVEPEALLGARPGKKATTSKKKPGKPEKAKHVRFEESIQTALKALGNEKLSSLYYSICSIDLDPHAPIVAVGVWSFFETLTACAGRNDGVSFDSFLSKSKLKSMGIDKELTSLNEAMVRIRGGGNTTKHSKVSVLFNGDQLNNDVVALKDVILKCIAAATLGK